MEWIKIESGCEMPNNGEKVLVWLPLIEQIAVNEWNIISSDPEDYCAEWFYELHTPSHWARMEGPEA